MEVVVHRASPEGNQVRGVEGQVVPAVVLYCFPKAHEQPRPQRGHVFREKKRAQQGSYSQHERLHRVRVLRRDSERVRVFVVYLVHVFVHALVVQPPVDPVKVEILDHEKGWELPQQVSHGRERQRHAEPEKPRHPVEHELHGELHEHVRQQQAFQALQHRVRIRRLVRLDLPSLEIRKLIHEKPRKPRGEIHELVEHERQRARDDEVREVVQHPGPPNCHLAMHQRLRGHERNEHVVQAQTIEAQREDDVSSDVGRRVRHDRGGSDDETHDSETRRHGVHGVGKEGARRRETGRRASGSMTKHAPSGQTTNPFSKFTWSHQF
mmetsp:Transcript_11581/g.42884  ORF Transcript_11581/g.42884 Transcript_11581/m.42884 type:complete len:323 (+) Transcript_11581:3269-4237(+)